MSAQPLPRCGDSGGRTQDGKPCGAILGLDPVSGLCRIHDPASQAEAQAARAEGGRVAGIVRRVERERRATTEPANMPAFEPDTLERVAAWLQWTARAVAVGEISGKVAAEITRACKELRPTLTALDVEKRVKALEKALKAARKKLEGR